MNKYYGIAGSNELLDAPDDPGENYIEMSGDRPNYYSVATSGGEWEDDLALKATIDAAAP